jgi:hypothetical protein
MNKKQRNKNRENAHNLSYAFRQAQMDKHICEECGEPGGHWISTRGISLMGLITGVDDQEGFWTCAKFYGANGRRIDA